MPLDGSTSVPFLKVKPEFDQAPQNNYQFTGNTNKEIYTTEMQSQKSSLWETTGPMSTLLKQRNYKQRKKYRWRGKLQSGDDNNYQPSAMLCTLFGSWFIIFFRQLKV